MNCCTFQLLAACVSIVQSLFPYVQEYIEIEGAGILLSAEFGLVLFHLDHVWYEGDKVTLNSINNSLDFLPS